MKKGNMKMDYQYNDGGRKDAGYKGDSGDCVARAVSIAAELPYKEVYNDLAYGNAAQRKTRRSHRSSGKRTAQNGIQTQREWFKNYMEYLGFVWTPTMKIGQGCKVHLRADELPAGRLVVSVSRHYVAVIDGVINDTFDPSRDGMRCVYGYWSKATA
jgi:hypothetical protein